MNGKQNILILLSVGDFVLFSGRNTAVDALAQVNWNPGNCDYDAHLPHKIRIQLRSIQIIAE